MPRSLEFEAETVDAAVDRALEALNATRDAVDVEVLDSGRSGLLGMGGRTVRVRVTLRDFAAAPHEDAEEDTAEAFADEPPSATDADDDDVSATEGEDSHAEVDDGEPAAEEPPPAPARRPRRARRSITGRDGVVRRPRGPRRVKPSEAATRAAPSPAVQREADRDAGRREPVHPRRDRGAAVERSADRSPREERPVREDRSPREDRPAREERPAREHRGQRDDSDRGERDRERPREKPRRGREAARESTRGRRRRPRVATAEAFTRDPQEVALELLDLIGCEAEVQVEGGGEAYEVEIDADDTSLLIGRHGQNLESLQYIVNRICNRGVSEPTPIMLDVAGYRERRIETLEGLADSLADKVLRTRRPISMEPLPPHERRIIHLYLRDDEDVETFSRGDGDERYLVIAPRRGRRG